VDDERSLDRVTREAEAARDSRAARDGVVIPPERK